MKLLIATFSCAAFIILTFVFWGEQLELAMSQFLQSCIHAPNKYSFFSFIFLSSDIVLPVPSSIIMFLNGHIMGVWMGSLLSYVSVLVSAVIGYAVGYYFAFRSKSTEGLKAAELLNKYGILAIIMSRGIPILSETFCFVCGYSEMKFTTYLKANCLGYLPVSFVYALIGKVSQNTNLFYIAFLLSIAASGIIAIIGKHYFSTPENGLVKKEIR